MEKEIRGIIRNHYAVSGRIEGYDGLLFTYEDLEQKEKEMIDFIRQTLAQREKEILEEVEYRFDNAKTMIKEGLDPRIIIHYLVQVLKALKEKILKKVV